ncbi:tRNA pseudouridine synthase Pus10-like protein [Perkinsela sp. CCAP 1560/4]|nr:tRNA pseudouridine synthase Pus10-like protein [Perkinsela sp. CCAP 1560/4]|eukprot:KNH08222.1 tRNA pseudouridine synthase Pus10-like protein [Perkinsela sp. CCAP 1560/4]
MKEQIYCSETHNHTTNNVVPNESFETILFEAIHLDYVDHYCVKNVGERPNSATDDSDQLRDTFCSASLRKRKKPMDYFTELPNLRREKMVREPYGFCLLQSELNQTTLLVPCVYLGGKYIKYQRHMPQTPWWIGSGEKCIRVGSSSVEEVIQSCTLTTTGQMFENDGIFPWEEKANNFSFYSLGREDRDVRMLGEGRPFLLKIKGAKRIPSLPLEKEASDITSVQVHSLRYAAPRYVEWLKDPQKEHFKAYRAVVYCKRRFPFSYGTISSERYHSHDYKLSNSEMDFNCFLRESKQQTAELFIRRSCNSLKHSGESIKILQRTPIRVCHRRAHLEREKFISKLELQFLNEHFAIMDVVCSAGTYVKEFVHGDHGRTYPSLSNLLHAPCDILQLDVMSIES